MRTRNEAERQNNRSSSVHFISGSDICHNLANVWQDNPSQDYLLCYLDG